MEVADLLKNINDCIATLVMKFKECPYNFFTESDAHSYLYHTFFNCKSRAIKIPYPENIPKIKTTVLIHREYPTFFRYSQKEHPIKRYSLEKRAGTTVGHYDVVVLNPNFIAEHKLQSVIAKDNTIRKELSKKLNDSPLLAAIEFKLIHKPLTDDLKEEIRKDFFKLREALRPDPQPDAISTTAQAEEAFMLIFNRDDKQTKRQIIWRWLKDLYLEHPEVKLIYVESYYKDQKRIPPQTLVSPNVHFLSSSIKA